jgi:CubicO group peptidase (beta-lactamase class C family)
MTAAADHCGAALLRRLDHLRELPLACALIAFLAGCASPLPSSSHDVIASRLLVPHSPHFSDSGPDADEYGAGKTYPVGDESTYAEMPFLVGSFSNLDRIFTGRLVRRAATSSSLHRAPVEPAIRYEHGGEVRTLPEYLARHPVTGFLVARGDTILAERYQYARNDLHRFTSWSMAKTITAILIGIAIAEGHIRSVDDTAAAYVPALAGTEYGRTPLRHLLQMSSGVLFREQGADLGSLAFDTFHQFSRGGVETVRPYNVRVGPIGTRFSYSSADAQVLGLVLRSAVGRPLAEYLQEKLWEPMGAEADASWLIDRSGQEVGFCCINAILRDFGRLGLLLAHEGHWRGRQIIPAGWIAAATRIRDDEPHLRPGTAHPIAGYGYQVWILPGERRMYALLGRHGQATFVEPSSRLVMVHTAVRRQAYDPDGHAEMTALWRGIVRQIAR